MLISKNAQYCWELLHFKVENELFIVPSTHFASNPNPPFKDIFSLKLPPTHWTGAEGRSPINPIVLEQISKVDFERFLSVLYPNSSLILYDSIDSASWLSVLKLSTTWHFIALRKMAIRCLSNTKRKDFTAFDRLKAAQQYSIPEWFRSSINQIVHQAVLEGISDKDAAIVGDRTARVLLNMKILYHQSRPRSHVLKKIEEMFHKSFGAQSRHIQARSKIIEEMGKKDGVEDPDVRAFYEAFPSSSSEA
ncbi:hypothetical protein PQX77_018638 [Marasmius sp. AFHP31]|nr:hypothetical protein PQX77_018638 [Marasmius sp. AFHP31]